MKRICCNPECGWVGDEEDCMDFKHPVGERLCPECHEVTEPIYFEWVCPRCGAILPSTDEHCPCECEVNKE